MSNIRGLFSDKKKDRDSDDNDSDDDGNNRFVGGIGDRGGGSGLAVRPNPRLGGGGSGGTTDNESDAIFRLAEDASAVDGDDNDNVDDNEENGGRRSGGPRVRRTITMYRTGFVVDDGPYRRLDDPNNREFLQYLSQGRTPPELLSLSEGISSSSGNVTVGLIDKRTEEYVEPFRSFSGTGQSLRGDENSAVASNDDNDDTLFEVSALPPPSDNDVNATIAAVQVRLPNGQRRAVRLPVTSTIRDLAARVVSGSDAPARFRLVAGFPPKPLRGSDTIEGAQLKGAQVSLQPVV